uniref:Ectonucleotide pyrophosphatase/phosphodiesterase family member 5 n=1 Tax=Cacopsylla melanoneura TaxID=428564 RepID=A0A8D9F2M4_9HEMI
MSLYMQYLCILTTFSIQLASSISTHPLILIVSFDGFYYDYLNRGITPNLLQLRSEGVYSQYMRNIFPTKTYPNHHSISTGLYAEQHGVIDNHIFDVKTNEVFNYSKAMFLRDDVIPIYTLNELAGNGRYSGSMMWPGSDYQYKNNTITYFKKYQYGGSWNAKVDEVVGWFTNKDKPANLVMLYFDEPDGHGHMFGPNSPNISTQIARCDAITRYLLDQLDHVGLKEKINLFILSDHGMSKVQMRDIIDLSPWVNDTNAKFGGGSPTIEIFPNQGKEDEIYQMLSKAAAKLTTFQVFKKEDMPERWHYKNNERTPPILALANVDYAFKDIWDEIKWFEKYNVTVTPDSTIGLHGYDNTDGASPMYPIFLASGPLLKKSTRVDPFENIHLFSLWRQMLKLDPPTAPNLVTPGSLRSVDNLLADSGSETSTAPYLATVLLVVVILGSVIFILVIYENFGGLIRLRELISPITRSRNSQSSRRDTTQYRPLSELAEESEESPEESDNRTSSARTPRV